MDIEYFREYCLNKAETEESTPFGPETLVFKVMGKMYAATSLVAEEFKVNRKCDTDYAIELRERFPDIQPGYHMNKKHWNTIHFESELDDQLLEELVDHSYDLVKASLPKKIRDELQ